MRRMICYALAVMLGMMGMAASVVIAQSTTTTAPTTRELSPDVKELIRHIAENEKKLHNLYVEGEYWQEVQTKDGKWKRTPVGAKGAYWTDCRRDGKARLDVFKQVNPWIGGPAPYGEASFSTAFDGKTGVTLVITEGYHGHTFNVHRAVINATRQPMLENNNFSGATYSNVLISLAEQMTGLGHLAQTVPGTPVTLVKDKWEGVDALKLSIGGKGHMEWTWWVDPARGYSLIRFYIHSGSQDRPQMDHRILKLEEVAPGVWYPKEAVAVIHQPNEPVSRNHYRAAKIVANNPNFDTGVFTLKIPKGYRVDDQTKPKAEIPVEKMTPEQRNIRSASNLRQIGQAVRLYAAEHKGHGPKALEDLEKVGISAETLICPVAGKHYVYFGYEKEGNPLAVVAYEESDDDQASVNILCANGKVGLFSADDAFRIVKNGWSEKSDWGW